MQLLCCEWDYLFFNLQKEQLRWDSCLFISLIPGQSSTLLPTLPLQLVEKKGASAKQFLSFAAPIFWAYLLFFITSYYLTRFYFFQSVMGLANMEPDGCRGFLQDIAPSLIPLHSNLVQVCSSHSFSSALCTYLPQVVGDIYSTSKKVTGLVLSRKGVTKSYLAFRSPAKMLY